MKSSIRLSIKWHDMLKFAYSYYTDYINGLKQKNVFMDRFEENIFKDLKDKVDYYDVVSLNATEMLFTLLVVDHTNKHMLKTLKLPYTDIEMKYFKDSQNFMEKYNHYTDLRQAWRNLKSDGTNKT